MCYHKPQYNIKYTDAQKQCIYCTSTSRVVYDLIYNIFQLAVAAEAAVSATSATTSSATACEYDESTILATSMDYHYGC